ncbi:MAG: hypothetical protein P8Y70_18265, partial [Candidatus Lokiarchaeota archaeon]
MIFPDVIGSNLRRRKLRLPIDLSGDLNLLIISFKHTQHTMIEQWLNFLTSLEMKFPKLKSYEIPTFGLYYKFIKSKLEKAMISKVTEKNIQEKIITLFLRKTKFKKTLGIPNEDTIYMFLVDRRGYIHWTST